VVVPEDQLSLAIGRDGQNARLAAKLTSWRIDIKSLSEAAGDSVHKLKTDATMVAIAEQEADMIELIGAMLAKKAEGRPLNPEEYDQMGQFVDRVEKRAVKQQARKAAEVQQKVEAARSILPEGEFEKSILDSGLPDHVATLLQGAGYATVGDLAMQIQTDVDPIFRLQGIGPKAMSEIQRLMDSFAEQMAVKTEPEAPAAELAQAEATAVEAAVAGEPTLAETTAVDSTTTVEQPVEVEAPAEAQAVEAEVAEGQAEPIVEVGEAVPVAEEEEPSFDQLFSLKPELVVPPADFEEEEESEEDKAKKKKGKKKKHVEVVYDPDRDMTIVKRKHKRGEDGFDWE
jgi:N utilization substance protein A